MSFDETSDRMNWKDELSWMAMAGLSGLLQWLLFRHFGTFASANQIMVLAVTLLAFYLLGVLVRIQNVRGRVLTGRKAFPERILIWVYPVPGFLIGLALIIF